jgi:photosystem II stability/assembly factor-like uncharacterized protein
MPKTVLMVGTRKGLFLLESENRRDWTSRGPLCESWPIYHAILNEDGEIYAAAASEWLGASVWKSTDLGETWTQSSEGLNYENAGDGLKLNKISSLAFADGRLLVGAESVGLFESTDRGQTFSLVSTLDGAPGRQVWNDPAMQPPGHLGLSAILPFPDSRDHLRVIVQGNSIFDTDDGGKTWVPRNVGLRRDWPAPENPEVGFCVHKLAPSPDPQRWYQQNHVGTWRSDDGGMSWQEITEGLPADFGFAAAAHPHDRDTFYCIPLDGGHGRTMPDGQAQVWRTRDAGSSWQQLVRGLPERDAHIGVLREGMTNDAQDDFGLYFGTSTGQVFASVDEGDNWLQVADYLPAISSVKVATLA